MLEFDIYFSGKIRLVQEESHSHICIMVEESNTLKDIIPESMEVFISDSKNGWVDSRFKAEIGTKDGKCNKLLKIEKSNKIQ